MRKLTFLFAVLLLYVCAASQSKTYYISPSGNDANNGLSIATAWRTPSNINVLDLEPGDKILFEGGQSFTGNIQLDANDLGTAINPITISVYGSGKATINVFNAAGIYASNSGGVLIKNLVLKGDGTDHDGIDFMLSQTSADIEHIYIDSVEVSGFGGRGCLIGAYSTDKGFSDVNVQHSSFHNNTIAGFESFGEWPSFSNTGLYVGYCKFYNNPGKLTSTVNTGNGIVISGFDGGVIEYCESYNNGADNRSPGGGPVGIWVYDTKNITIQYCESHHNKAGLTKDGGGFDMDGGSQYCIVQYCYSHDNEGYGFALVEYGSPNEFTGNIIRYNVSQNDCRKNSYGAITLYAEDATHRVKNCEVYNNTLYVDANNLVNGKPSAVNIISQNFSNVSIRNNIFYVTAGVDMMTAYYNLPTTEIYFQRNNYFSSAATYDFWWNGNHYTSVNDWRNAASGQETNAGISTAISQNPLLEGPGSGGTVRPADGGRFNSLFGYFLNPFSPMVDKAVKTGDMGTHDFFGNALPLTSDYDIGAAEAITSFILPVTITSFIAKTSDNDVALQWTVAAKNYVEKYEIQKSVNGRDFITIATVAVNGTTTYNFTDKNERSAKSYYRIRFVYPNGRSGFSNTIKISKNNGKSSYAFYKDGQGAIIEWHSQGERKAMVTAYSSNGSLLYSSTQNLKEGLNVISISDARQWMHGIYFFHVISDETTVLKLMK
jgi:hypothetical protein